MGSMITVRQHDATVRIPAFLGLYQDGDGISADARYALEAVNVDTRGGVLRPAARWAYHKSSFLEFPIETLALLHRRYHADETQRDVLICASEGRLRYMIAADGGWVPEIPAKGGVESPALWRPIAMPAGVARFQSDRWSWASYEINPDKDSDPVDVLLLSNAKDGMIMVRGDTMEASVVQTPYKFGVIARYAERIWGGAIEDDPDTLAYSKPFNPTDWATDFDIPADGGGNVQQPTWDGDSFTALVAFGAQMLAFKQSRVWRVLGTDPGEYVFKEQYGGGAAYTDTLAAVGEQVLLLSDEGLMAYDGLSVAPYAQHFARDVFARMHKGALARATACVYKNRYYCALPLDGSAVNNAVLVVDLAEQTWLLHEGTCVRDFLPGEGALYFTNAENPCYVCRWGEDARETGALPCRWVTPWMDLGGMDVRCGGFTVYLSVAAEAPAALRVTVRTERRARTKTAWIAETPPGRKPRPVRLRFPIRGNRFQLALESAGKAPWRLLGGLQAEVELDAR